MSRKPIFEELQPISSDEELYEQFARDVRTAIDAEVEPLKKQIEMQAKQIETLQRTTLKDGGIWRTGRESKCGDVVTDKGAMWVCRSDNKSRPGEGPNWRLMFKTDVKP